MRPRRCASSWREPNVPDTWISTLASGRSMAKLPTFDRIRTADLAGAEACVQVLALGVGGLAGDERERRSARRAAVSCLRYWPMISTGCAR